MATTNSPFSLISTKTACLIDTCFSLYIITDAVHQVWCLCIATRSAVSNIQWQYLQHLLPLPRSVSQIGFSHIGSALLLIIHFFIGQFCISYAIFFLMVMLLNTQSYPTLGILQARILKWVAFPFSRGSSQPRDQTQVSNPDLPHCRRILYQLSYKGSPKSESHSFA